MQTFGNKRAKMKRGERERDYQNAEPLTLNCWLNPRIEEHLKGSESPIVPLYGLKRSSIASISVLLKHKNLGWWA